MSSHSISLLCLAILLLARSTNQFNPFLPRSWLRPMIPPKFGQQTISPVSAQKSGQQAISPRSALTSGQQTSIPISALSGQQASIPISALKSGQQAISSKSALKSGQQTNSSRPTLKPGQEAISSKPAIKSGQQAISYKPALNSGQNAINSKPSLKSGQQAIRSKFSRQQAVGPKSASKLSQQASRNPPGSQRRITKKRIKDSGIQTSRSTVQPPVSEVIKAQEDQPDDWWYGMGQSWETSDNLAQLSPYYAWYKQTAIQMSLHSFAQHVGKIYRGQFLNPELNMPRDRAFGYQSDFNPEDLKSGAFKHKPQGQIFRATEVHVYEGLASHVGEVRTMPAGQHVQEDGTILIQTSAKDKTPCHPNPCTNLRMPVCTVVNDVTAKCSRSKDFKLTLTWKDPKDDGMDNDLSLTLVPAFHNGFQCPQLEDDDVLLADHAECGAEMSEDDFTDWDYNPNLAEESATLTTLTDGTKYQDFTYSILVYMESWFNNLSEGVPQLTVEYDGVVEQELSIPQYDGSANINSEWREYYFFGCFRPQLGRVDTRGSGFYKDDGEDAIGDLDILHVGLCKALLDWPGGPGFNHYHQIDGDETNYPTV